MADASADYHRGDQNIKAQAGTYAAFGALTKYGALTVATLVLMLTLWFCLDAGFFGGLIPGVVLAALGVFFLRSRPAQDH